MKLRGILVTSFALAGMIWACGGEQKNSPPPEPVPAPESTPTEPQVEPILRIEVKGNALFGNQCPYGSYVPPGPVPIELWECPIQLPSVELSEPLPAFILQADCKKKTLDVRSNDRTIQPITWEVMPDGNFYFTMNAGMAKLKDDGAGHQDCSMPMVADVWGRIDCQDRDKAVIHYETVWWLGKKLDANSEGTGASPAPSPSSSPTMPLIASPSPSPWVSPSPGISPFPWISSEPTWPVPTRTSRPRPNPGNGRTEPVMAPSQCSLPQGCYFHTLSKMNQCL